MLSDLCVRVYAGDLIYMTGFRPKGQGRFSRRCLFSVCSSVAYLIVTMIQGAGLQCWQRILAIHHHGWQSILALEIDPPSP